MVDVLGIKNIKNIKRRIFLFYILSVVNLFIYADENIFSCCNFSFINTKNSEKVNIIKNILDYYDGEIYEEKDIEQDSIYNMPNSNIILDKIYTLQEGNYKHGINTQHNFLNFGNYKYGINKYGINTPYNFFNFGNSIEIFSKENKNINQNSIINIEEENDENVFIEKRNDENVFIEDVEITNNNIKNKVSTKFRERIKRDKNKSKKKKEKLLYSKRERSNIVPIQNEKKLPSLACKYPINNLIREIKHIILNEILIFLNVKIPKFVNINDLLTFIKTKDHTITSLAINKIKREKSFLLTLNGTFLDNAEVKHSKVLLNQSIGKILSNEISAKYKRYNKNFNKYIIEFLYQNSEYLKQILNLKFIEVVQYFSGVKDLSCLEGMKKWYKIKRKLFPKKSIYNKDHLNRLDFCVKNYETIILQRKKKKD